MGCVPIRRSVAVSGQPVRDGPLGGGALADDPHRRRATAVGGYASTAVLSALIGAASTEWQAGVLRAGAWVSCGLRVPSRNALLADTVPTSAYGRAYGFVRAMDNLGVILGPLLALPLVGLVGVRTAILLSVIAGLLAVAIVYAIRHTARPKQQEHQPIRLGGRHPRRGGSRRLELRRARRHPELRQPRGQQHRGPASCVHLSDRRLPLPAGAMVLAAGLSRSAHWGASAS